MTVKSVVLDRAQIRTVKGLVTNYGEGGGGLQNGRGGAREVLPLWKGGAEKVLAILKGGHKKFSLFKRGGVKSFTLS